MARQRARKPQPDDLDRAGCDPATHHDADADADATPSFHALLLPQHVPAALVAPLLRQSPPLFWQDDGQAEALLRGALTSVSLSVVEKARVLDAMPTLSAWQAQELLKVFSDERDSFARLVPTEFDQIARLQAEALWTLAALAVERTGASLHLACAWVRRSVRQMAAQGLQDHLALLPASWWAGHAVARWAYRSLYDAGHPAWQD